MRNLLLIILPCILLSCENNLTIDNDSIIGKEFEQFKEINLLSDYTKVSDTAIYGKNIEAKYGILHLRDKEKNLIVFKNISLDSDRNRVFKILDTLVIPNSFRTELITIGYCYINNASKENIITLVSNTELPKIKKAWIANMESDKIEVITDLNGIECFNEWLKD